MWVCVCEWECERETANEKEREKIWWIVSYMETISSAVIYGVNNRVYSQACSPVVFLFVVGWQKYYSQTTHLLHPILIQKPIKPSARLHLYHLAAWAESCAHMHSNSWLCLYLHTFADQDKHNYKPKIILSVSCAKISVFFWPFAAKKRNIQKVILHLEWKGLECDPVQMYGLKPVSVGWKNK